MDEKLIPTRISVVRCQVDGSSPLPVASDGHQRLLASALFPACHIEHSSCWSYIQIVLAQKRIKFKCCHKTFPVFFFFFGHFSVFMPSFILMPSDCSRLLAVVFRPGSSVKMDGGVLRETLPFALSHHFWLFDKKKKKRHRQREQSSGRKSDASSSVALLWGQKKMIT